MTKSQKYYEARAHLSHADSAIDSARSIMPSSRANEGARAVDRSLNHIQSMIRICMRQLDCYGDACATTTPKGDKS
jgi:hypothetical protein